MNQIQLIDNLNAQQYVMVDRSENSIEVAGESIDTKETWHQNCHCHFATVKHAIGFFVPCERLPRLHALTVKCINGFTFR